MMTRSDTEFLRTRRRQPWSLAVAHLACLVGLALLVWSLASLRLDHSVSEEAGRANLRELWPMWVSAFVLWTALSVLWWQLTRRRPTRACKQTFLREGAWVVLVALTARGIVLLTHQPTLSDDIHRYTFDGHNLAHGVNPYIPVPSDRADATDARWQHEQTIAELVNHPDLTTIYLPMSQWVFAGAALLTPERAAGPDTIERVFRTVFVVFDISIVVIILFLLFFAQRSAWWAALYAWHPLAIIEVAGSGHQDVIGIALLLVGLLVFLRASKRTVRWSAPLAMSILVKPVAAPIALRMLKGQHWTRWSIGLVTAVAVSILVAGPLLLSQNRAPLTHLRHTTERFTLKWAHFGAVYETMLWTVDSVTIEGENTAADGSTTWTGEDQERLARKICALLAVIAIAAVILSRLDIQQAVLAIILTMLVFSTTVHPWYVLWALALVPLARRGTFVLATWVLSLTALLSYSAWAYLPADDGALRWAAPAWVVACAWLPVYAAVPVGVIHAVHRRRTG